MVKEGSYNNYKVETSQEPTYTKGEGEERLLAGIPDKTSTKRKRGLRRGRKEEFSQENDSSFNANWGVSAGKKDRLAREKEKRGRNARSRGVEFPKKKQKGRGVPSQEADL